MMTAPLLRPAVSLAFALGLAATPLQADPLPQGAFILGTHIWPDLALPRYATLMIDGAQITVELSSPIALNWTACDTSGDCTYAANAAQAQADVQDGTVRLSAVDIFTDVILDDHAPQEAHTVYTANLLARIDGATVDQTDFGFTLSSDGQQVAFYRADAVARAAVLAYPMAMELSISGLAACEVRAIAPLFTRTDLSPGEAQFRAALEGLVHRVEINRDVRRRDAIIGDRSAEDHAATRALIRASMVPPLMATGPDGPLSADAFWDAYGSRMFEDDRAAFDAVLAGYGDNLQPMVAFLAHLAETGAEQLAHAPCQDLSAGFIAAQDG